MDNQLLKDFLKHQNTHINTVTPANKNIVRPEKMVKKVEPGSEDIDGMYNFILEKKPNKKKVIKFLQLCIDSLNDD
jgi:hypothetical protein